MNLKKKFSILEKLQSTFLERFINSYQVFSQKSRNLTSLGAKIIGLLCVFAENNRVVLFCTLHGWTGRWVKDRHPTDNQIKEKKNKFMSFILHNTVNIEHVRL